MAGYRVRFYDDDDEPPPLEDDVEEDPYIDGVPPPDFRPLERVPETVVMPPPSPPRSPPPPAPPPPPPVMMQAPPPIVFLPTAQPPVGAAGPEFAMPPPAVPMPIPVAMPAPPMPMPMPPPPVMMAEPPLPPPPVPPADAPVPPVEAYFKTATPGLPPGYVAPQAMEGAFFHQGAPDMQHANGLYPPVMMEPKPMEVAPEEIVVTGGNHSPGALRDFQVVSGFRDLWAAILFMLHVAVVAAMAIIFGLRALGKSDDSLAVGNRGGRQYDILDWVPQLGAAGAVGLVFALVWQSMFRVFLDDVIVWAMWFGVFAMFSLGILLIATGTAIGTVGLIFIFFSVLQALFAHSASNRKEFTTDMLAKMLTMKTRYRISIFFVTWVALMVAAAWEGVFIFGVAGAISQSYAGYYIFIFIVSLAWVMEVIKNVVNVTVSGLIATHYFQENCMPRGPVRHALHRACSTCFGSICLGSTLVAPIEFLRLVVHTVSSAQGGSEFPFACCGCLQSALLWLTRYFNKWAYVHVSIYGKSFVWAARSTWDMFKRQGVEPLLENDLSNNVFFVGSFAGGSLSAIVGAGWEWATHKNFTVSVAVISFFLGYFFTYIAVVVYQSGMAAIYVCYAEDPETLRRHDPEMYARMQDRLNFLKQ